METLCFDLADILKEMELGSGAGVPASFHLHSPQGAWSAKRLSCSSQPLLLPLLTGRRLMEA